jgi:hypothetical protein
MSAVTEWVVKEYFEQIGYLVSQPRKYTVPARTKRAEEEVDLVICNPKIKEHALPESFIWEKRDLKNVARAVIGVRGWHTDRFYPSTFEQTPEILKFVEKDSVAYASELLGDSDMAKILCLPRLPASGELKNKTIQVLKRKGVDGVISFRTMLAELIAGVDTKKNYEKSDLLQIIRLLKNYDLVKGSQLELFGAARKKK